MREQLSIRMLPQCKNASVQSIRREVDWAWLAGIIDGEGNLNYYSQVHQNGRSYSRPQIRVANTDVRMIAKVSRILHSEDIIFSYSINQQGKNGKKYKPQMVIQIASSEACLKIVDKILPYLANKKEQAIAFCDLIKYVKNFPQGGYTVSYNYLEDDGYKKLYEKFRREFTWHIDPSTITRRAREPLSLGDMI